MLIGKEKYKGFDYEIHLTGNDKKNWREHVNHFYFDCGSFGTHYYATHKKCDVRGKALAAQCGEAKQLHERLAAHQLVIKEMREALAVIVGALVLRHNNRAMYALEVHEYTRCEKALALQPSTEALHALQTICIWSGYTPTQQDFNKFKGTP